MKQKANTPATETNPAKTISDNEKRMKEVEKKAAELSEKLGTKVTAIVFNNPETHEIEAVGYLKDPTLQVKLAVMDLAGQGMPFSSAEAILESCLIREESDPRFISKEPENHAFYLGAVNEANKLVKMYVNQFKKK